MTTSLDFPLATLLSDSRGSFFEPRQFVRTYSKWRSRTFSLGRTCRRFSRGRTVLQPGLLELAVFGSGTRDSVALANGSETCRALLEAFVDFSRQQRRRIATCEFRCCSRRRDPAGRRCDSEGASLRIAQLMSLGSKILIGC